MVRGIDNRVKISQIVDSQLPQFITDTLSIVEETSTYTTNSGTYSRSGNSVSVYSSNHQLSLGQKIYVEYIQSKNVFTQSYPKTLHSCLHLFSHFSHYIGCYDNTKCRR